MTINRSNITDSIATGLVRLVMPTGMSRTRPMVGKVGGRLEGCGANQSMAIWPSRWRANAVRSQPVDGPRNKVYEEQSGAPTPRFACRYSASAG